MALRVCRAPGSSASQWGAWKSAAVRQCAVEGMSQNSVTSYGGEEAARW